MTVAFKQTDRAFGLTFAAVFAALALAGFFLFGTLMIWAALLSALFLASAFLMPWVLLPLNRLWSAFAWRLGHVSNFVLLGTFFFLFILPAGLIMRLFSDPMNRKIDRTAQSYWSTVGRKADDTTYRDMF